MGQDPNGEIAELAVLVREGFNTLGKELGEVSGNTSARLKLVEEQVQGLTIRMAPVLKAFENDLTTRIALLENWVETSGKEHELEIQGAKSKVLAAFATSTLALLGALGTVIWAVINK